MTHGAFCASSRATSQWQTKHTDSYWKKTKYYSLYVVVTAVELTNFLIEFAGHNILATNWQTVHQALGQLEPHIKHMLTAEI